MRLHISNSTKRDATIVATAVKLPAGPTPSKDGKPVSFKRYIAAGEGKLHEEMVAVHGDDYSKALINGDPEVDLEIVGRVIDGTSTVLLDNSNTPLFSAPEIFEIIYAPDGSEVERRTPVEVAPNVNEEIPISWTGRLMPRSDLVRKFAIKRSMQLRHVDGVTFDFLFGIAKELDEKDSVMLLGAGEGGKAPLILQANGSGYRGFLEGRIKGDEFLLLLHLSNMELKKPAAKAEKE